MLAAFAVGAVLGGLAALQAPAAVPAAILVPLAAVVACSLPAAAHRGPLGSRMPMSAGLTAVTALTTWQFVPIVSVPLAIGAALCLAGARAVARRHPARPWPGIRTAAFLAGLAVIAVAIRDPTACTTTFCCVPIWCSTCC